MTSENFCYWLQGYIELSRGRSEPGITADQAQVIKEHLAMVFVHDIDPKAGDAVEQAKLNALHEGVSREEMQSAIADAISKIPRPPTFHPLGKDLLLRC